MAGTNVPFVHGTAADYARALDRLHRETHAPAAEGWTGWLGTAATCAALLTGLAVALPVLPGTLAGVATPPTAGIAAGPAAADAARLPRFAERAELPYLRPIGLVPHDARGDGRRRI